MKNLIYLILALLLFVVCTSAGYKDLLKALQKSLDVYHDQLPQEKVYVQTDKTYYKPGEYIWYKSFLMNATDNKASSVSNIMYVELTDPWGNVVRKNTHDTFKGACHGEIYLSPDVAGGLYKLTAYTKWMKNWGDEVLFTKEITVQKVITPRLLLKLDFEKRAYGPGDKVVANLKVTDLDNVETTGSIARSAIRINGETIHTMENTTQSGESIITFHLPDQLDSADGILQIIVNDKGIEESITRSIPIVLNKIAVRFYPEGGTLMKGVTSKMAFKAVNEWGKGADISGHIVDNTGMVVADFESYHLGMGAFEFTPQHNRDYYAVITTPKGNDDKIALPVAKEKSHLLQLRSKDENKLVWNIYEPGYGRNITLIGQTQGVIHYAEKMKLSRGNNTVEISADKFPVGAAVFTLFDHQNQEVCHRMVFMNEQKGLNISIESKDNYLQGEPGHIRIKTTDAADKPVSASLGLAVVDEQLLTMADDKQDNILSYTLFSSELKERVQEPYFYFDEKELKAKDAIDYLMLTSDWRRFAWNELMAGVSDDFITESPEKNNSIHGIVLNKKDKPVQTDVFLIDMSGETCIAQVKTTTDGHFEFHDLNYSTTLFVATKRPNQVFVFQGDGQISGNPPVNIFDRFKRIFSSRKAQDQVLYEPDMMIFEEETISVEESPVEQRMESVERVRENMDVSEIKISNQEIIVEPIAESEMPWSAVDADMQIIMEPSYVSAPNHDTTLGMRRSIFTGPEYTGAYVYIENLYHRPRNFNPYQHNNNFDQSTVYWNGNLQTGPNGEVDVYFSNNRQSSTFRITVEGLAGDKGLIGSQTRRIVTNKPLAVDAKVPMFVGVGDVVRLPVIVKNTTGERLDARLNVTLPSCFSRMDHMNTVTVEPDEYKTVYVAFKVKPYVGTVDLAIDARSSQYSDRIRRSITVRQIYFPYQYSFSGQDAGKTATINLTEYVPGTLQAEAVCYVNMLDELFDGVESIFREPYGCFEQVSSSTFPNIFAMQLMQVTGQDKPDVRDKAMKYLMNGYKRLAAYEVPGGGFEWYGGTPAHEVLSAYGLVEFHEMSKIYKDVDRNMMDRALKFILSRRDGDGGFRQNNGKYGFSGAPKNVNNAYIVYALTETGYKEHIAKEYQTTLQEALKSNDIYRKALLANAAFQMKDMANYRVLVGQFKEIASRTGFAEMKVEATIVRSYGETAQREAIAFWMLALLKNKAGMDQMLVQKCLEYINKGRNHGSFGNTQATSICLQALTRYAETIKRNPVSGSFYLQVNGKETCQELNQKQKVIMPFADRLNPGANQVTVKFDKTKEYLPYTVNLSWQTFTPATSKWCPLKLTTHMPANTMKVNETMRLSVVLENTENVGKPMSVAIIGIPGGLSLQPWQLKELQEKEVFDFYEIINDNLVVYYRELGPREIKTIDLDLKAEIPGTYRGIASSAYVYYMNEHKYWIKGIEMNVLENQVEK